MTDWSKKSLFLNVSTNHTFEILWQRHSRAKKRKEGVQQAPEKPRKQLEIMEDISKSLRLVPSGDNLFSMMGAAEIKNLSPKKMKKIKFEINILLLKLLRKR